MIKRIIALLLVLISSLSAFSSIRPFLSISPYFVMDGHEVLDPKPEWKSDKDDYGYQYLLDRYDGIPSSSETIQDSLLRFGERKPLLEAGFEIEGERVFFALKMEIREELYNFVTVSPKSNIPYLGNTRYAITDAQYPQVAFLEYSNPYLLFSIGRRKLDMGPGKYSFILSSEAQPNLDSLVLGAFYNEGDFSLDYSFYAIPGTGEVFTPYGDASDIYKTFFVHKVAAANSYFRFGLSEINCVYGSYPTLMDFTPFVLWHNLYVDEHSNVMIEVSLEGKIGPVRLWGEYAQDDLYLNFGGLTEGGFNNKPTAIGVGLGFDWLLLDGEEYGRSDRSTLGYAFKEETLEEKGGLHLYGEFYWASNYLYNRRSNYSVNYGGDIGTVTVFKNDQYGKFTLPYRFYSSHGGTTDKKDAYFLGFPFGPGTIYGMVSLEGENSRMKYGVGLSLLMRGEKDINSTIDSSSATDCIELQGEIKKIWSISTSLRLNASEIYRGLELDASTTFSYDEYYSTWVPEIAIGVVVTI